MPNLKLTDKEFWDQYWLTKSLPLESKKSKDDPFLYEILDCLERNLPTDESLSVLEIGGSPGQYLAFLHRTFGYQINCLDYSSIGCKKTKENFQLLGIPCGVYEQDLFSNKLHLPLFDIVYSLGFIEHFSEPDLIVQKHLELLKPNGIVFFGLPNFLGINHFFLKRLAPELLRKHNLKTMNLENWTIFEKKFNLELIIKGYVGGFHPSTFNRMERKSLKNLIYLNFVKILVFIFKKHLNWFRKFNSRYLSGYIFAFYRRQS